MASTNNSNRSGGVAAGGHDASSAAAAAAPATRGLGRRPASKAWEFFSRSTNEKNKYIAVCPSPTCRRKLSACSRGGTSHLLRHRCYREWLEVQQAPPPAGAAAAADEDAMIFGGLDDIVALDPMESVEMALLQIASKTPTFIHEIK